ncbi:hypothetical protein GCM10010360_27730 [Streptomyces nogalater]
MKRPSFFRRCGHRPGAPTPEDQAALDTVRTTRPRTGHRRTRRPVHRARTPRPGDDHVPDMISLALVHPGHPRPRRLPPQSPARLHEPWLATLADDIGMDPVSDRHLFADPYEADVVELLETTAAQGSA